MIDFYPEFTNLCNETLRYGHQMEQAALSKCRLAIYASGWAAKSAINCYDVDCEKIKVVPYGANVSRSPGWDGMRRAIAERDPNACKLLFVGVDWYRKGGEQALSVTSLLNQRGVAAELHVVGCQPPSPRPHFVKTYGYLSKRNREQSELLSKLYETSTFLIFPSKAEGFGIVVAEASAFGLPALTTNVGGITTAVKNGRNGRSFDPLSFVQECTDYILQMCSSKERYHELCRSSFDDYAGRLNWQSAVRSVRELIVSNVGLA